MRSNGNPKRKKSTVRRQAKSAEAPKQEANEAEELYDDISGSFLLNYKINDKGVGHISLPPSLSMLLQSDQIYISPFGGGLFIRSVSHSQLNEAL